MGSEWGYRSEWVSPFFREMDRTTWQYDAATGLLTNKLYADGKGTAYTYDTAGRLASRTWVRGITTAYSYDAAGNLTGINYSDTTPSVSFTYDRLGRQRTITDILGTRTNEYDAATLQLIAEKRPDGTTLGRAYDEMGRSAGLALGSDYSVTYSYDTVGRFSSISSSVSSAQSAVSYSYLPNSDLIAGYTLSPGGSAVPLTVSHAYEEHRNLKPQVLNSSGTNLISHFDYENDAIGRRTRRTDTLAASPVPLTNDFAYNIRSELIEAVMGANNFAYQYDPIGNRELTRINANTNSYTANELNQYLSVTSASSAVSPVFDDDGNMTEYGDLAFTWDGENRLVAVASNGVTVVQSHYDYMSRRIMKATATQTNEYLYDGWNMIRETQVSGFSSQVSSFVWGLDLSGTLQGAGGIGGLLSVTKHEAQSTKHYAIAYDANGNVTELVDTNGAIVARYEYDPYGNAITTEGTEARSNPFRFSTKYTDDETGLVYYGYRFCHPELGRWINRDPIGDISFISRYLQQRPPREHNRLNRAGLKQSYLFVDNTSLNGCDPVGLDNLTGGQNDPPAQICKIPCGGRYIDPLSQGCCNEQPFQLATECCAGAFVGDKVPFYEAAGYSNPDDCVGDFLAGTSPWVPALGGLIGLIPPAGIIGGIGGAVFVGGLYAICNAPFCMAREAGKGPISDPISGPRL